MGLNTTPLETVCLDAFSIGRYEVTFHEYDQFTSRDTGFRLVMEH